jgi:signal transduction histidine kinase
LVETAFQLKTSDPALGLALIQDAKEQAAAIDYQQGKANALHTGGMLYWYQGLYQYAFEQYLAATLLREEIGDSLGLGRSYQNLGLVMEWLGRDSMAIDYFTRSLQVRQAIGDSVGIIYAQVNLSESQLNQGANWQEVSARLFDVLALARRVNNQRAEAYVHSHLGNVYMSQKRWGLAQQHVQAAIDMCEELQDANGYCRNQVKLAHIFLALDQPEEALRLVKDAELSLEQLDALSVLEEALQMKAQALGRLGRWQEAYDAQERLRAIAQERNRKQKDVALSMLQLQHDTQQKDREIQLLREKEENYGLRLSILVMLLALLITGGVMAFFIISFRSQRAVANLLRQQQETMREKNAELARSNAELADFAHAASHDLKEPLRTMGSYAGLLHRRYGSQLDDDAQTYLGFLQSSTQQLWSLLDDLLVYARIGQQAEWETLDLNQLMEHLAAQLASQVNAEQAQLTILPLPTVWGYRSSLSRLFQNLISNALKFHGEQPPVIEIGHRPVGPEHHFWVKDQGIGIAKDYQVRVFQAFKRLHRKEQYPGTGLGLAIALKVVQQHQGRIWVESTPGQGSTFWFTLPVNPTEPAAQSSQMGDAIQ